MEENPIFPALKAEILRRAKEAGACEKEYRRAYAAESLRGLLRVVKDNFFWATGNKVITADLIEQYRDAFAKYNIYLNVDARKGYLLCTGNAEVVAGGFAKVWAFDSATVAAYDNAEVWATCSTVVVAHDNASVRAYDNASVRASGIADVKAFGNAKVLAYDYTTVWAYGSADVVAFGNAYCTSDYVLECKLSGNSIYRVESTNTIYFASDELRFVKQDSSQAKNS